MTKTANGYVVEFWQSHKDEGNDDHLTGSDEDIGNPEQAFEVLARFKEIKWLKSQWAYAFIEGPDGRIHEERNPDYVEAIDNDDDTEFAMQQGMGFGIGAYNEAMGFEQGGPDDDYAPSFRM